MGDLKEHEIQAERNLEEVKQLKLAIDELSSAIRNNTSTSFESSEVSKLTLENTKLKHRLAILNRAMSNVRPSNLKMKRMNDRMESIFECLYSTFEEAIKTSFPDLVDPPIVLALSSKDPKFGDYQCNSALPIANIMKQQGVGTNPLEIAKSIISNLTKSDIIDKVQIAGPGFINIYLSKHYALKSLMNVFKHGVKPPQVDEKKRVLVDFSSPNIAKEMHVGHLRSTIIGESICRLLEYLGHDVLRINHVGDWGTQFGMLIAHLEDKFPDYLTKSPPISNLQAFYKESKKRFDEDEAFKKRAYSCVVKLQAFEPNYLKAWQLICDVSRKEFQKIYDRLDIKLVEKGESFYQSRMEKVVEELKEKNLLEFDEGRLIMWGEDKPIPMTIVKTDGGYTYDTSDMAAIKYRFHEEKVDWIVYITDAGQATHFDLLFSCAKKAGILDASKRVDHVGFGVVLGEDKKKFKTRSSETIRLSDLLDEGLARAMDKLKEKERDKVLSVEELKSAQESVAYGCIKYADLSHNWNHEYVFSFDKMLEDKGNTAVYLLYAYTRICSIARNANFDEHKIKELSEKEMITLDHDKEWKLAKVLLKFPDILIKITKDLYLHNLCEYVYEISTTFSEFYDNCYCIEKDSSGDIVKVNHGRILLSELTARILAQCFYILGLKPVTKM